MVFIFVIQQNNIMNTDIILYINLLSIISHTSNFGRDLKDELDVLLNNDTRLPRGVDSNDV